MKFVEITEDEAVKRLAWKIGLSTPINWSNEILQAPHAVEKMVRKSLRVIFDIIQRAEPMCPMCSGFVRYSKAVEAPFNSPQYFISTIPIATGIFCQNCGWVYSGETYEDEIEYLLSKLKHRYCYMEDTPSGNRICKYCGRWE